MGWSPPTGGGGSSTVVGTFPGSFQPGYYEWTSSASPVLPAGHYAAQVISGGGAGGGVVAGLTNLNPSFSATAHGNNTLTFSNTGLVTLSALLSTGAPITSLPVNAIPAAIPANTPIMLTANVFGTGVQQIFTTSGPSIQGATSIPVVSQTPNFAYVNGTFTFPLGLCIVPGQFVTGAGLYGSVIVAAVTTTQCTLSTIAYPNPPGFIGSLTNTSYTFTVPPTSGGGGGAPSTFEGVFTSDGITALSVTIGAGGAGVAGNFGNNGGNSTITGGGGIVTPPFSPPGGGGFVGHPGRLRRRGRGRLFLCAVLVLPLHPDRLRDLPTVRHGRVAELQPTGHGRGGDQ